MDIITAIINLEADLFVETLGYVSALSILGHIATKSKIGVRISYLIYSNDSIARVIRNSFRNAITVICSHAELLYEQSNFQQLLIERDSPLVIVKSLL